MRRLACLAVALLLILAVASPGTARVARIETTAALEDHAAQSVNMALKEAVNVAVKGAVAMGLPWVKISQAFVLEDRVAVRILATDTAPDDGDQEGPEPDAEPSPGSEQPSESAL